MADEELLEIGGRRRGRVSTRARVVLVCAAAVLALAGYLVDREVRAREQRAVATCAAEVATTVDLAGRRVRAIYEYVRPTLAGASTTPLRNGLYRLIAKTARRAVGRLPVAGGSCDGISVLPVHEELRTRRDRCLEVLERQRSGLKAVAADGSTVLEWASAPRSC